jgi:hypothetical protein
MSVLGGRRDQFRSSASLNSISSRRSESLGLVVSTEVSYYRLDYDDKDGIKGIIYHLPIRMGTTIDIDIRLGYPVISTSSTEFHLIVPKIPSHPCIPYSADSYRHP